MLYTEQVSSFSIEFSSDEPIAPWSLASKARGVEGWVGKMRCEGRRGPVRGGVGEKRQER